MKRAIALLLLALAAAPTAAQASTLTFSFSGIAGTGSSIDLGSGPVNVSGAAFTASGQTLNDVDVYNGGAVGDSIGFFAATVTYDFGASGAFTTDAGADFYGQACVGLGSVSCALLSDVAASAGFRIDFAPAVPGDPDFGIALGTQTGVGSLMIGRTQTNALSQSLTMGGGGAQILSVTSTANDAVRTADVPATVPEPATIVLLGSGCISAIAARRRRKQRP